MGKEVLTVPLTPRSSLLEIEGWAEEDSFRQWDEGFTRTADALAGRETGEEVLIVPTTPRSSLLATDGCAVSVSENRLQR
jgi:hypothetical protein